MFKMTLVWVELTLDAFLVKKAETSVSPSPGQRQGEGSGLPKSQLFSDTDSEEGIQFITGMVESSLVDLLGEKQSHFTVRVYWMKGRWALAENHMDKAVEMLDLVRECLCEEDAVNKVYLPNCRQDKVISLDEVKRQQESLKRCQSLEESQRLFDSKQYQLVVKSLTATFTPVQTTHRVLKPALPERHAQLELLQEALYCLEDWGQCLLWGEVVLDEALHHYRRAPTVSTRDSWALTLVHLLEGLHRVLNKDVLALKSLSLRNLIRLTQNLMRIIEINHDVSEAVTDMPIGSVLPWMVLYRIIRHEENKLEEAKIDDMDSPGSPQAAISSSLMLLSVAHEYLGRNAWCTRENGVFLLFYLNIVKTLLPEAHDSTTDHLNTAFEQCVFCLYGHPNKKGKARHLFDHNAPCIDLTWEQCASVFDYFKPKSLPEIDSYKTSTMSAELENLLRKMYSLIPESEETSQRLDVVHQFIEGNIDNPPSFSSNSPILQELYYLLADYYFKNKEPTKAIKFYLYDVCFNSNRIDSWAGLALSKMAQLEQKLNSMELKIDAPLHKKSIAALRCFSRAVDIDETVRMLWIEYGGLAYQLHSHASRQLRMQLWFPLTPDLLDIAKETRVEMLATARNCYWKASKCEAEGNEEEWLHHYMMGKVMEKQRAHPRLYLEHYKQAAIYLHEDEAKYPRKINYHTSPPHLSLEALEMYYRLHVAVMKHLLRVSEPQTKEDMVLFDRYVTEARESPFALRKEKRYEAQESVSSADDSQCSVTSIPPYSTSHQRPVYHMTPQDHNYSKQKSTSGDTSDASCEVKETGTETDGSQSQSSEETDGVSKCGTQTTRPAERQSDMKGATGPESSSVEHESSQVQMVELHAESDSHTTSPLTHAKPLLFEKQVSEGFIPVMDKKGSLSGSTSSSAKPPPFSTPAASIHVLPDDEQIRPAEETMAKADHSSALVTKTDDPIETDSFGDQKLEGGGKIVSHDDVLKTTNPDSKLVDGNSPHGIFSEQKGQPQSILNKAACADSSMKIVLPSDDLSQDNGEESVTSPGLPSSQIYVISSDDDCSSEISSRIPTLKRPRPPLPEQCKRPRLSVGMAEEADGKREKKKTSVVEVEEGVTGDRVEMSADVQLHEKTQEQVDTVSAPAKSDKAAGNIALDEKNEKQPKTSQPGAGDNIPLGDGTDTKDAKQETKNAADGTVITDIQQYSAHQTRLASEKEGTPTDSGSEKNGDTVMKESGLSSRLQQGQCKEPAGSSESRPAEGYLSKTSKKLAWEHNPLTESYQQTASDGKKPSSVSQHPQPQAVGQLQQTPVSGSDLSEQKPSSAQDGVKPSMSLSESSGKLAEQKCLWAGQGQAQQATLLGEEEYEEWKRKLLNKCADGLHVCLSRFPTHYKSLYRLAYLYFASDSHKNLEYARDLLLGNLDWQNQNHMPSNGLFSDRKSNNFFNGIWKIPIDEIDRSGSFASHVNRSVQLLLEVLCDIGDVTMLHTLHSQLKKKPSDQARKYLRDGERLVLAQMAHSYMLDAVAKLLDRPDRDKTELLLLAFKAYNAHRFGVEAQRAMALLVAAHQRLDLPKQGHGQPVEQAVQYCNSVIASQVMAQKAEKNRLLQQSVGTVTSLTLPSTGFPYTVDAGTTPQRSLVPLIRPLSPGYSVSGRSLPVFPGPHSLTSIAHEVHQSYNTSVQASTLHPAHTPSGRARTLSASSEEHPSALDLSARHQQHVATAALDLSSSSRQRSRPVEPTTQYQKSPSMSPVTKCKVRTDGNVSVASEEGIISSRSIQTLSPVSRQKIHPGIPASSALSPKDLLASPRSGAQHVGSFSPESVRSPGARISLQQRGQCTPPGPGGRVSLQQRAPCTPPSHRGPSSFLSASRGIHLSPSTSTPITPTRPPSLLDDASDCNAASDQGDELFLTSPDKLTSEMRHHMHGNLL